MSEENDNTPEIVEEVVTEETALPEEAVTHDPPPWAEQLIQAVESLPDKIAAVMPNPVNPEVGPEEGGEDTGFEDEAPSRPPWTHRVF